MLGEEMISTTLEERIDILESSEKGEPTWRIAQRMKWDARTIQKWRKRGQEEGRAGLQSKMGRPSSGSLGGYPSEMREAIRRWRRENPGWGPKTLRTELSLHPRFEGTRLPSRSSIARFLNEEGLVAARKKSLELPESERIVVGRAHQVWEMDARGYDKIPDIGFVSLIDLNDRYTHARILSYPCSLGRERVERHPQREDYQAALRTAFMEWGMPQALQVDHDSVFYNNKSTSPFPTRFHLWLIALGITLSFIRFKMPEDQGMTERSHEIWYQQVIRGHSFSEWPAIYTKLLERRRFLNWHLPSASLVDLPPLVAFPKATHSGCHYHLAYEEDMLDLERVYLYLQQGKWFRLVSNSGTVSLGGQVYSVGTQWRQQQVEISFDPEFHTLLFYNDAASLVATHSIKGISKSELMGNIADFSCMAPFQMALPFSWEQQRDARLFETIS